MLPWFSLLALSAAACRPSADAESASSPENDLQLFCGVFDDPELRKLLATSTPDKRFEMWAMFLSKQLESDEAKSFFRSLADLPPERGHCSALREFAAKHGNEDWRCFHLCPAQERYSPAMLEGLLVPTTVSATPVPPIFDLEALTPPTWVLSVVDGVVRQRDGAFVSLDAELEALAATLHPTPEEPLYLLVDARTEMGALRPLLAALRRPESETPPRLRFVVARGVEGQRSSLQSFQNDAEGYLDAHVSTHSSWPRVQLQLSREGIAILLRESPTAPVIALPPPEGCNNPSLTLCANEAQEERYAWSELYNALLVLKSMGVAATGGLELVCTDDVPFEIVSKVMGVARYQRVERGAPSNGPVQSLAQDSFALSLPAVDKAGTPLALFPEPFLIASPLELPPAAPPLDVWVSTPAIAHLALIGVHLLRPLIDDCLKLPNKSGHTRIQTKVSFSPFFTSKARGVSPNDPIARCLAESGKLLATLPLGIPNPSLSFTVELPPSAPELAGSALEPSESEPASPLTNAGKTVFRQGSVGVEGALEQRIIAKVVHQHKNDILTCYRRANKPRLEGELVITCSIDGSGDVRAAQLESSTLANTVVEGCLIKELLHWRFPAPKDHGEVQLRLHWSFAKE